MEPRTLLAASTDEDGNVHISFDGWLSVWDESEGRVLLNSHAGNLCALVAVEKDGHLPTIRGGEGREVYEPWVGYEGGELFVQGPCGRFIVRAYGDDGSGTSIITFSAAEIEPEQQSYEGFAIYKQTDLDYTATQYEWVADSLTLGQALDVARDMAEKGRSR